jgi:hypothetical protein
MDACGDEDSRAEGKGKKQRKSPSSHLSPLSVWRSE